MSFSLHFELARGESVYDAVLTAYADKAQEHQESNGTGVEAARAVRVAVGAVLAAIEAVGGNGADYYVSVAGHVNPDNQPSPGWANDHLTVSVSVKSYVGADAGA